MPGRNMSGIRVNVITTLEPQVSLSFLTATVTMETKLLLTQEGGGALL